MADLTVETGDSVPNANSYVTLEYADEYFVLYGVPTWAAYTEDQKIAALIQGCRAMEDLYQMRYLGTVKRADQGLMFPRYEFVDHLNRYVRGIPTCLKQAQCEAALLAASGTVNMFPEYDRVNSVRAESVTVGEISTSTQYGNTAASHQTSYGSDWRKVELRLAPIITKTPTSSSVMFVR